MRPQVHDRHATGFGLPDLRPPLNWRQRIGTALVMAVGIGVSVFASAAIVALLIDGAGWS